MYQIGTIKYPKNNKNKKYTNFSSKSAIIKLKYEDVGP